MAAAEDRRSTDDALLGRTIAGKYTIESRVGGGGMGSVYRARQAGLDKIVAIKVLHRELLAEPTFATRFKREATAASKIDHPCSMRVLDFGEEPDGLLYIAMEFLQGRTLHSLIHEEAPLAPARIVDLSRQILAALAVAHDLGIVHRDLKPENVLILPGKDDDGGATELVKVCDFGIAKLQKPTDTDEKLTIEGSIVGTPEYLSPEQARGGALDARSDLYSMGVILFEMLTGEPPFRGDTPLAIVLKHLDAPPPIPSMITPRADPKLEAVCLKALSKLPADRFASARDMRASLVTDTPDAAAPPQLHRPSGGVLLVPMTETPPPVTSTQGRIPLSAVRAVGGSGTAPNAGFGSGSRPRLSTFSDPPTSKGGGALVAVVALALVGGGAGAFWLRKHAPQTVGVQAAVVAPLATPSAASSPATAGAAKSHAEANLPAPLPPPTAHAGDGVTPVVGPAPSASTSRRRTRAGVAVAAAASGGTARGGSSGEPVILDNADDMGGKDTPTAAPAPSGGGAANVRVADVRANGVGSTTVSGALPMGRIAACYHASSGAHERAQLHLELRRSKTTASVVDTPTPGLAACVGDAASNMIVRGIPAEGASADVTIDFTMP